MKKKLKQILFFTSCFFSICAIGQNLISPITITLPTNPPPNTAEWATSIPPLMIMAQTKLVNGQVSGMVIESKILVTIKSGGAKVCGTNTAATASTSGFSNATKTWSGANVLSLIGQDCILKAGSYELCVQFYSLEQRLIGESCKPFTIADKKDKPTYTPPTNISPANDKVLAEKEAKTPLTFRWTPIVPKPKEQISYKLKVWQLMKGQNATTALKANRPVVEKEVKEITQYVKPNLMGDIEMLENKADLVWRVEASKRNQMGEVEMLGVSEPSFFKVITQVKEEPTTIKNIQPANNITLTEEDLDRPITFRWTPIVPKPKELVTYRLKVWKIEQSDDTLVPWKPLFTKDVKDITEVQITTRGICNRLPCPVKNIVWSVEATKKNQMGEVEMLGISEPTNFKIQILTKPDTCQWKMVDGGCLYNVAIRADGTLWWFKHFSKSLDNYLTSATFEHPKLISSSKDWSSLSAGIWHFYALKKDGTLWTMGENINGTIGDGTYTDKTTLTQVGNANDWKNISTNYNHSLAIKNNGSLWCWGNNTYYQLSNLVSQNTNMNTPIQIGTDLDWKIICAGSMSSFAIKQDGTLWAWGWNGYGQIGDGTRINKQIPIKIGNSIWKKISSNGNTTFGIKDDGTLWAWGLNTIGQFGNNTTLPSNVPLQIGTLNTWTEIDSYGDYAIALKSNNSLWAWGKNNYGKIGDNSTVSKKIPTQISSTNQWRYASTSQYHSTAIDSNGKILVWGFATRSSSGSSGSMILVPTPIQCEINY
jgi:alpha-tubulin suppressor-like RCC1 family protein